jgi:hypothetical protein
MASIVPDVFAAFALVEANGFAAADVEKFQDQARGAYSACRTAALHGVSFTLWCIFLQISYHCAPTLRANQNTFEPSLIAKAKSGVSLCYDAGYSFELTPPIHPQRRCAEPARRRKHHEVTRC